MQTACCYQFVGQGAVYIMVAPPRNPIKDAAYCWELAPQRTWLRMPYEEYRPLYDAQLAMLDPEHMWERLHRMAWPHAPVLLCAERPPLTAQNWCHRRMVAEWFREHLGHEVPEMGYGWVPAMPPAGPEQLDMWE